MSTINERMKEVRKVLNYNQKDFAVELGISRTHISNMENGNDNPSTALIKLICMRFNIDEEWLTTGNGGYFPGFNSHTREGLVSRYNSIRVGYERRLGTLSEMDLLNTVESFAYLDSLLCAAKLEEVEKTEYLMFVHEVVDDFEKLIFRASSVEKLFSKKDQERYLSQYKNEMNDQINMIAENIKNAANIYLSKLGDIAKL